MSGEREQHSADWQRFISRRESMVAAEQWEVWSDGMLQDSWRTRYLARLHMHWIKLAAGVAS